jgi:hypothetical protein
VRQDENQGLAGNLLVPSSQGLSNCVIISVWRLEKKLSFEKQRGPMEIYIPDHYGVGVIRASFLSIHGIRVRLKGGEVHIDQGFAQLPI